MDIRNTTSNPRPPTFQILVVDCSIDICIRGELLKKSVYHQGVRIIFFLPFRRWKAKKEAEDLLVGINFNYTGNFNTSTTHNCSHKQNYTKTTLQRLDIEPSLVQPGSVARNCFLPKIDNKCKLARYLDTVLLLRRICVFSI